MLKVIDYARLSQDVYNKISVYTRITINNSTQLDDGIYMVVDADSSVNFSDDFFAALYIKFQDGEATDAVIAVRGTVASKISNILADVVSWYSSAAGTSWFDHVPFFYDTAVKFLRNARNYLKTNFPYLTDAHIGITGHSLGGALAQCLSLLDYPLKSVVFNSPGCGTILSSSKHSRWTLVNNYNVKYDIVSKIGKVIGALIVLDLEAIGNETITHETDAEALFNSFDKQAFNTSVQEDKVGDLLGGSFVGVAETLLGAENRVKSISSTFGALEKEPDVQAQFVKCENPSDLSEWQQLVAKFSKSGAQDACQTDILLTNYADTLGAQHSIDNIVTVLSTPTYAGKANTMI